MSKLKNFVETLSKVPKVVVLDIDYTIWPFHIDCHGTLPFKSNGHGGATDRFGLKMDLFRDVHLIFSELDSVGIKIAAASRTDDPPASKALLTALSLYEQFHFMEIYPGQKFAHFERIRSQSGVEYVDMLFFDDDFRNIRDISKLGVTCFFIEDDNGISLSRLKQGLEQFNKT